MLLNYRCPDCKTIMVNKEGPPRCWMCRQQLLPAHALVSNPGVTSTIEDKQLTCAQRVRRMSLASPAMLVMCHSCQEDHYFGHYGALMERCPTCGESWRYLTAGADYGDEDGDDDEGEDQT